MILSSQRKSAHGFTLLELVIVIVVLAILAGLAVPRYVRTVNRSRGSEALTMLDAIRQSLERRYARNNTYVGACFASTGGCAATGALDIDPTTDISGTANFTYVLSGLAADAFTVTATCGAACGAGTNTIALSKAAGAAIVTTGAGTFLGI